MERVLSVQDLSCAGRCSLTVAMPVISALGCRCTVLPTAVLSTHTAFPKPFVRDLTEDIAPIREHWKSIGAEFDVISIGYLSDPGQAEAVEALLDAFPGFVILDPAMGDGGRLYSRITGEHVQAMSRLAKRAQLLLPNVTEAAALTGIGYEETHEEAYYRSLAAGVRKLGAQSVVITGVTLQAGKIGFLAADDRGEYFYQAKRHRRAFHGTGDLFSAVMAGAIARGMELREAAALAAGFVEKCVSSTREQTHWGVEFEKQLPWLWQKLQSTPKCCSCPGF